MLAVLLTVLKIIGIVLLAIIGLVLAILLIVLFVPIRYKIYASKTDEKTDNVSVLAKITWLLHLINARVAYPAEELICVRISFFKIFPKKEKHKEIKSNNRKIRDKSKKDESVEEKTFAETSNEETVNEESVKEEPIKAESIDKVQEVINETVEENFDEDESEKKSIKDFINKICEMIRHFRETVNGIINKIKDIYNNIAYYLNVIDSNAFQHSVSLAKKQLGKVFKALKPRKIKGYFNFGSDDPATTAKVFGLYTVAKPYLGKKFSVYPYFDRETVEGEIYVQGRLRIITLIVIGIKVYFNKDVKRTIKLFKKETKNG